MFWNLFLNSSRKIFNSARFPEVRATPSLALLAEKPISFLDTTQAASCLRKTKHVTTGPIGEGTRTAQLLYTEDKWKVG